MPFSDLNDDILRHIAFFLQPFGPETWRYHLRSRSTMREPLRDPGDGLAQSVSSTIFPECPSAHWRRVPLMDGSLDHVRAFRASCRRVWCAVAPPDEFVYIEEHDIRRVLAMARAPELRDLLGRVKRLKVVGRHHANLASAHRSYAMFLSFVQLFQALHILELENTFCAHPSYGVSGDDNMRNSVYSFADADDLDLPDVRILVTESECHVCCGAIPLVMGSRLPNVERLKLASPPSHTPALSTLIDTLRISPVRNSLTCLVLKLPDWLYPELLLQCLVRCAALEELFVSFYDLSRKVNVVTAVENALFLDAVAKIPTLHTLDMCLSTACIVGEPDPEVYPKHQQVIDASRALASAGIKRGWWWTRVVDLDYAQLIGYERLAWEAQPAEADGAEPNIVVAPQPAWLHPIVVRNADGQGTDLPMPDEMWG